MSRFKDGWPIPAETEQEILEINIRFAIKCFPLLIERGVLPRGALALLQNNDTPAWKRNEKYHEWEPQIIRHIDNLGYAAETDRLSDQIQEREELIAQQRRTIEQLQSNQQEPARPTMRKVGRRQHQSNAWLIERHLDNSTPLVNLKGEWLSMRATEGVEEPVDPIDSMKAVIKAEQRKRGGNRKK